MRIRATAAAAVIMGAVALTAAAMPAAQASSPTASSHQTWQLGTRFATAHPATAARALTARTQAGDPGQPYQLNATFSNLKIDSGKTAVAVGTTNVVHVPYSYTLTAVATNVSATDFVTGVGIYRGSADAPSNELFGVNPATCKVTSSTSGPDGSVQVENCAGTVDIDPTTDLTLADAGAKWHTEALAIAYNGQETSSNPDFTKVGIADVTGGTAPTLQRYSKLTVNASPEPVVKGKTVTVVGSLTRANWETHKYAGYTVQPVKMQFRVKTSSTYTTLKTVTSDSHGNLKTTSTAKVDGYWRYSFAGTATTPAVSAAGDYVDVK